MNWDQLQVDFLIPLSLAVMGVVVSVYLPKPTHSYFSELDLQVKLFFLSVPPASL